MTLYGKGDEGSVPFVPSTTSPRLQIVRIRVAFLSERRFLLDSDKARNSSFILPDQHLYLSQLSRPINMKALATERGVLQFMFNSQPQEERKHTSSSILPSKDSAQGANCNSDKEEEERTRQEVGVLLLLKALNLDTSSCLVDLVLSLVTCVYCSSSSLSPP